MPFSKKKKICIRPPYRNGLVLQGYDLVEYHNLKKDQDGKIGKSKFTYHLLNNGANYEFRFINQTNLKLFQDNINKYLPQFGGFCSWGFANEWENEIPPNCKDCLTGWPWNKWIMGPPANPKNSWSIYQNKLYFNINPYYKQLWETNPLEFINRAQKRWQHYYGNKIGPLNVASFPDTWRSQTHLTPQQMNCLSQNKKSTYSLFENKSNSLGGSNPGTH